MGRRGSCSVPLRVRLPVGEAQEKCLDLDLAFYTSPPAGIGLDGYRVDHSTSTLARALHPALHFAATFDLFSSSRPRTTT